MRFFYFLLAVPILFPSVPTLSSISVVSILSFYFCTQIQFTMAGRKIENNQKKIIAHDYYKAGYSQIEISQKIGISQQTLSRWVKEGSWKQERTSITQTRQELLKQYHDQLSELNHSINTRDKGKRIPTKPEADIMTQLINAMQKLENDASVSEIISVFTDFLDFIRKSSPYKAVEISDFCDAYIKSRM